MLARLKRFAPVFGLFVGLLSPMLAMAQTATLLPNAVQQYFKDDGTPASSGSVYYYVPNTTTKKNTWKDSGKTQLNTNPVLLDAAGRPDSNGAGTYGDGIYRQVLQDADGNTIWDSLTASTGAGSSGTGGLGFGITVGTVLPWAGIALPAANYRYADGSTIVRADYPIYVTAVTQTYTTTCSSGSPTLSGLSETLRIPIGAAVEGACIAPGTTVLSKTSTSLTLSNNATASISTTIRVFPWGNGDGATTINLPNFQGRTLFGRNNMDGTAGTSNITSTYYGANPNALGARTANPAAESRTLAQANLPNVNFNVTVTSSVNDVVRAPTGFGTVATAAGSFAAPAGGGDRQAITSTGTAASGGTGTAFSVINPGITVDYVVKIAPDADAGACPPPSATTLGCILLSTAPANQYATGVDTDGNLIYSPLPNMAAATIKMNPTTGSQPQADYTIGSLNAIAACDPNLDFIPIQDHTTGEIRRVTCGQISSGGVSGVTSWGTLTGVIGLASGGGLAVSGSNATTTYSQSGTATARTIPNRLQDTISIGDFTAGGTANDTTGVQAAFDACTTAGGCTMICRNNVTYTVDNINIGSNLRLIGKCTFQQRTFSQSILTATTKSNILIDGVTFLATSPTVNTAPLVQFTTVNNARVINSHFQGSATVDTGLASPTGGANGIQMDSLGGGTSSSNVQIEGNYFYRFNFIPVRAYATSNLKVLGNVFQSNAFGVYVTAANRFEITGNILDTTALYATSPTASQFAVAIGLESTDGHSLGISQRGVISNNVMRRWGWSQGVLVHAGTTLTINGNTCEETGICISLNPFNSTDTLSNVTITGNQTNGATGLSAIPPGSGDPGIVVQSGAAPLPLITSVTVSGNVITSHNRVTGDAASGCILIGYVNLVNVTGNSMTGCGANNIVISSPIEKSIISGNNMSDTITKAATNNGVYFTSAATGARVNATGNFFQDMSVGYRYFTGISTGNIQTTSTLCVTVTNCVVGP